MILAACDCFLVFFAIVLDLSLVHDITESAIVMVVVIPGLLSMLLSLGLFEANAIQFGMDQLLESSSDQLSSFIHWYYWSSYVAFTYWENDIPPRIDLGKNKYGGPFTTEEVEDTKSFFHILLLLFSLLGFHLSGHGYSTLQQLMMAECPNTWLLILIGDPMNLTTIVVLIGVPLYQLINARYHQRYIPNIFKRMCLGLLCCLLKVIFEITLQITQKQYATQHCSKYCPLFQC